MWRWAGYRRARTLLVTSLVGMVSLVFVDDTRAQATPAQRVREVLQVRPGATCLNADQLAVQAAHRLEDVRVPNDLRFVVEGNPTDPRRARLRVVRGGQAVAYRAFEPGPAQCDNFLATVGFVIALAIKATQADQSTQTRAAAGSVHARGWALAATGLVSWRSLTKLAPGVELSVRRSVGEILELRVGALGVVALQTQLGADAGSFNAALIALRSDVCALTQLAGPLGVGLCVGAVGGALYAAGVDVPSPTTSVVPWLALAGAADVELEVSPRWSLTLGVSPTVLMHSVVVGLVDNDGARVAGRALPRFDLTASLGAVFRL